MGLGGGSGVIGLVELSRDADGNFVVEGSDERIKSVDAIEAECLFPLFLEDIDKGNTNRERYGLYVMQNNLDVNAYFRVSGGEAQRVGGRCNERVQFYKIEMEEVLDGKSI